MLALFPTKTGTHLEEFIQEKCKPVGQHLLCDRFCSVIGSRHSVSYNKINLTELVMRIDYLFARKDNSHLLSRSLGWFLLSRFLSIRSDSSCFSTPVAYSISPCSAVMIRDATLPRSRMENDLGK